MSSLLMPSRLSATTCVWCKTLKRVISWHFLAKVQKMFSAYVINFLAYKSFLTAGNSWQEVPPAVKIPKQFGGFLCEASGGWFHIAMGEWALSKGHLLRRCIVPTVANRNNSCSIRIIVGRLAYDWLILGVVLRYFGTLSMYISIFVFFDIQILVRPRQNFPNFKQLWGSPPGLGEPILNVSLLNSLLSSRWRCFYWFLWSVVVPVTFLKRGVFGGPRKCHAP